MKSWVGSYLDERILKYKNPRPFETLGLVRRGGRSSDTLEEDLGLW